MRQYSDSKWSEVEFDITKLQNFSIKAVDEKRGE